MKIINTLIILFIAYTLTFSNSEILQTESSGTSSEEVLSQEYYAADFSNLYNNKHVQQLMVRYENLFVHHDFNEFKFNKPYMEFSFGTGKYGHEQFNGKFAEAGFFEFGIGHSDLKKEAQYLAKYTDDYFTISKFSSDIYVDKPSDQEFTCDLIRLGIADKESFGYSFNKLSILPYQLFNMQITKLDNPEWEKLTDSVDIKTIRYYGDKFRFSYSMGLGLEIGLGEMIFINGGFESAMIYPRFMVWKCGCSLILESASNGLADAFVREVTESSPAAGPIVNMLLKNSISYIFYHFRKDDMNWPFESQAPLTYEMFKAGISFRF